MMEQTRVVFIILVSLCSVRDVHADTNLAAFSRKLNLLDRTTQAWKGTVVDLGTEISNNFDLLKEELTNTFIPALIKPLVKQAITGILKEEYIRNIISGRVLNVVNTLKTRVHNTKTQLRSVRRKFRQVKGERDSYKVSLGKLRGELTKDIHRGFQGIQQRIQELEERDALREKHIQDLMEQKQKATQSPEDCYRLLIASTDGNLEEVKRLLSLNVDVNCRWGFFSRTPVMVAAEGGHRDVVELLMSEGANVSMLDSNGDNTLHFACWGGDVETVEFVLSLNAVDIDARNNNGETAADWARSGRHRRVVNLLVSRGGH